uniref:Uncharacterized protein n=1 Tax=Glossina brevipalpis TaxID=37001 RepID=A0A1A9WP44_9MUSC
MNHRLRGALEDSMKQSDKTDLEAWNHIQSEMMCCGIDDPTDWRRLSLNKTLPSSCCRPQYIDERVGHCFDSVAWGKDKYFQHYSATIDKVRPNEMKSPKNKILMNNK